MGKLKWAVLLGLWASIAAHAVLRLQLTQGIAAATPIAVVVDQAAPAVLREQVLGVVRHDLSMSGRFKLIEKAQQDLQHAPNLSDVAGWKQQGVDYLVALSADAPGKASVAVYDLYQSHAADQARPQTTHLSPALRRSVTLTAHPHRVAHALSDQVYQQLTGKRGIFATHIAYVLRHGRDQYQLQLADADGANPRTLVSSLQPVMSPAWSPDGKRLAYVSFEQHFARVFVQEIASGKREIVAEYPGINGAPAWSPDGRQLAMVLTKQGDVNLFVLDLARHQLRQVTHGHVIDTEPAWAPDGKSIVFTSNRGGHPQIYQVTLANQAIARMTFQGNYNARASYTPDGKALVMLHREDGEFSIAKQDLETGRVMRLTHSSQDESPSIAANGQMVLYATRYRDRGVLAMVSIDGRIKLRLPSQEGQVQDPAFSPFV